MISKSYKKFLSRKRLLVNRKRFILQFSLENEKRLILIYGNFAAAESLINLDLVGDVGKRFQNDERHDEPFIDKRGEKYTDKNTEKKQENSAKAPSQKSVRLRQRKRSKHYEIGDKFQHQKAGNPCKRLRDCRKSDVGAQNRENKKRKKNSASGRQADSRYKIHLEKLFPRADLCRLVAARREKPDENSRQKYRQNVFERVDDHCRLARIIFVKQHFERNEVNPENRNDGNDKADD